MPVLAASLPEEPSIDAQAGSKSNKQTTLFASMIGSMMKKKIPVHHLKTVAPAEGAYISVSQSEESQGLWSL